MYNDGGFSDVMATDMNSMLHSSTFKHPCDGAFPKMEEFVPLDSYSNYNNDEHSYSQCRNQNNFQSHPRSDVLGQTESSLTRYRSAPSSFFASLLEESESDDFFATHTSSNHESFFSQHQQQQQPQQFQQQQPQQQQPQQFQQQQQFQKMDLPPVYTGMYGDHSQQVPHMQPRNTNGINNHPNPNNPMNSSTFRSMDSTSSNLIRQSSSPAGFLSTLNSESGFAGMRNVEKTISSSRLNNHINFSQGQSSSSMFLPQIPENKNQINDSTLKSLKRTRDIGDSIKLERQNGLSGHDTPNLIHHLSLPKTSSEMAIAEKFLRFEKELVPSKTRAVRGCATHPRSIAERVRRTRISNRMKKLQDLFPNMDKQTSTADMLDMAVQYIKDLQKDLQTLKDARSKCACSSKQ